MHMHLNMLFSFWPHLSVSCWTPELQKSSTEVVSVACYNNMLDPSYLRHDASSAAHMRQFLITSYISVCCSSFTFLTAQLQLHEATVNAVAWVLHSFCQIGKQLQSVSCPSQSQPSVYCAAASQNYQWQTCSGIKPQAMP